MISQNKMVATARAIYRFGLKQEPLRVRSLAILLIAVAACFADDER
jgi:hypothetical protein